MTKRDSLETAYLKALFAHAEELARESPSECVLLACNIALRKLRKALETRSIDYVDKTSVN